MTPEANLSHVFIFIIFMCVLLDYEAHSLLYFFVYVSQKVVPLSVVLFVIFRFGHPILQTFSDRL